MRQSLARQRQYCKSRRISQAIFGGSISSMETSTSIVFSKYKAHRLNSNKYLFGETKVYDFRIFKHDKTDNHEGDKKL